MNKTILILLIILDFLIVGILIFLLKKLNNNVVKEIEKKDNIDYTKYLNLIKNCQMLKIYKQKYNMFIKIAPFLFGAVIFMSFVVSFLVAKGNIKLFVIYLTILMILTLGSFLFYRLLPKTYKYKYNRIYKSMVIQTLLKEFGSNTLYLPGSGLSDGLYAFARFEDFDDYYSEDMITSSVNGIKFTLSDVKTYEKAIDDDNGPILKTIFSGTVAIAELPRNFNSFVYIVDNEYLDENHENYIEIDNSNFEEKYNVFSDNKILAMRLLTPEVTQAILKLYQNTKIKLEMKIYFNIICFRFHNSNLFESCFEDEEKEAYSAYKSIEEFKLIRNIIIEVIKLIDDLN